MTMTYLPEVFWDDTDRRNFLFRGVRPVCWYWHPSLIYRVGYPASVETIITAQQPKVSGCDLLNMITAWK